MNSSKVLALSGALALVLVLLGLFSAAGLAERASLQTAQLKGLNQFLSTKAVNAASAGSLLPSASTPTAAVTTQTAAPSAGSDVVAQLAEQIIPRGTPDIYGTELSVTFERPVEGLQTLAGLDGDLYPEGKLKFAQLDKAAQDRYLKIGFQIACEYCCGVKSLIQKNGQPACGCAHSAAMRGLVMYLLKNHPNEYTDEQILEQLQNWKTLFFPKQTLYKEIQLQAQAGKIDATVLSQIPDMVGGC